RQRRTLLAGAVAAALVASGARITVAALVTRERRVDATARPARDLGATLAVVAIERLTVLARGSVALLIAVALIAVVARRTGGNRGVVASPADARRVRALRHFVGAVDTSGKLVGAGATGVRCPARYAATATVEATGAAATLIATASLAQAGVTIGDRLELARLVHAGAGLARVAVAVRASFAGRAAANVFHAAARGAGRGGPLDERHATGAAQVQMTHAFEGRALVRANLPFFEQRPRRALAGQGVAAPLRARIGPRAAAAGQCLGRAREPLQRRAVR